MFSADSFSRSKWEKKTYKKHSERYICYWLIYADEDDFVANATTVFQAGGESTNTTMSWVLLFLLNNPDVQDRIHKEIDAKIGRNRSVLYSDSGKELYASTSCTAGLVIVTKTL